MKRPACPAGPFGLLSGYTSKHSYLRPVVCLQMHTPGLELLKQQSTRAPTVLQVLLA